jgi:hypothetical protein
MRVMATKRKRWQQPELEVQGPLEFGVRYRSPLMGDDHLLGRTKEHDEDGLAWCGRPLHVARYWDNEEFGGLWLSERTSGLCAECARRDKEWLGKS